jgi:uncharacterized protein
MNQRFSSGWRSTGPLPPTLANDPFSARRMAGYGLLLLLAVGLMGCQSLHFAVGRQDLVKVRELVEKGVDINGRRENLKRTPLIMAAYHSHVTIAAYLIEKGAAINLQDDRGFTALHYAAYYGSADMAALLLENGADRNIKDKRGYTAYDYAVRYGFTAVTALLQSPP